MPPTKVLQPSPLASVENQKSRHSTRRQITDKLSKHFFQARNLEQLSYNTHVLIASILLLQNIFVTIMRLDGYPTVIVLINLLEIVIYIGALLLFRIKKPKYSLFLAAYGIPLVFSFALIVWSGFVQALWFLMGFMLIYIMLIRGNRARMLYAAYCWAIFFLPGLLISYQHPEITIKIIQILSLTIIPLIIAAFVEHQDKRILKLIQESKTQLIEEERLSNTLQQKNEELVTFSHIMSHDLKSPLSTIKRFSQLLRKKLNFQNKSQEEYLGFIESSAESMSDLINDLLSYSKIDSNEYVHQIVDFNKVLLEIRSSFQYDLIEGKAEIKIADGLPMIEGHLSLIRMLFQNLISNGLNYQPKDDPEHLPKVHISAKSDETSCLVFIEDNGIGISDRYLQHLFVPFKRYHSDSEYKGTGLGMSICKKIMEKHGGKIEVSKTSSQGTNVKLTFPNTSLVSS